MKTLSLLITIVLSCSVIFSQGADTPSDPDVANLIYSDENIESTESDFNILKDIPKDKTEETLAKSLIDDPIFDFATIIEGEDFRDNVDEKTRFFTKLKKESQDLEKTLKPDTFRPPPLLKQNGTRDKFHWIPAIRESLYLLGIQHAFRTVEKKTRREFAGPFFRDWANSVKNLGGWGDGDSFKTNYIAHPMQGAVTGRIFLNNSDLGKRQEFGRSKKYWESRFKAMAWSAVWSAQFELGPISEASIGNVGLYDRSGSNRMGWVDLVVTPTTGTGTIIGEDILDKYLLKNWLEKKLESRSRMKIYRTFLTPFQSFTNVLRGKKPWHRDNR